MEFFPTHPKDKVEHEPELFAHEVFKGCIFSHHRNFSQSVEIAASDVSRSSWRTFSMQVQVIHSYESIFIGVWQQSQIVQSSGKIG